MPPDPILVTAHKDETVLAYVFARLMEDEQQPTGYRVQSGIVRSYLGLKIAQMASPEPIVAVKFEKLKKECPFKSKSQLIWALHYFVDNVVRYDRKPKSAQAVIDQLCEFAYDADLDVKEGFLALVRDPHKPLVTYVRPIQYHPLVHEPLYPEPDSFGEVTYPY